MISQNKLHQLYDGVINHEELTISNLIKYGINKNELAYLLSTGVLLEEDTGHYQFLATQDLYEYYKNNPISKNNLSKEKDVHKTPYLKNDNISKNYGIENLDSIIALLNCGITYDEVCQALNLEDKKVLVSLLLARECYLQEDYLTGNAFLKVVERIKEKTPFEKALFNTIRRDRKFYKNRVKNKKRLPLMVRRKKHSRNI